MLQKVLDWLKSDKNIFIMLGCVFEIMRSPEHADSQSITVDFDLNKYFCRLTFWDSGSGHIEVLETDSEVTIVDEGIDDIDTVFSSKTPFEKLAKKLSD